MPGFGPPLENFEPIPIRNELYPDDMGKPLLVADLGHLLFNPPGRSRSAPKKVLELHFISNHHCRRL
jgi:hypothetical protein